MSGHDVQLEPERGGGGFAGEVVFGGAEAAREHDDIGALQSDARGVSEVLQVVADDGLEGHLHAELVEAGGEVERVGVLAMRCEHLGAGGDNFGDHDLDWMIRAPVPQNYLCAGANVFSGCALLVGVRAR